MPTPLPVSVAHTFTPGRAAVGRRSIACERPTSASMDIKVSDEKPRRPVLTIMPSGGWIWNELTTQDEKTALAFYEKVFAFDHDEMAMPDSIYYVLKASGKGRAGLMKAPEVAVPTMWTPYVCVDDADATTARAKELGAMVIVPPSDIPDVGRFAVIGDPQGAGLAILRPNPDMH